MNIILKNNYTLRPVRKDDLNWLTKLRKETMAVHLLNSGMSNDESELKNRILYNFSAIQIIYVHGNPAGMLKVREDANYLELIQIQIKPDYQGQGLGEKILKDLIKRAKVKKLPVQLSVLKNNPAKCLYERLGFTTYDEDENSYKMAIN